MREPSPTAICPFCCEEIEESPYGATGEAILDIYGGHRRCVRASDPAYGDLITTYDDTQEWHSLWIVHSVDYDTFECGCVAYWRALHPNFSQKEMQLAYCAVQDVYVEHDDTLIYEGLPDMCQAVDLRYPLDENALATVRRGNEDCEWTGSGVEFRRPLNLDSPDENRVRISQMDVIRVWRVTTPDDELLGLFVDKRAAHQFASALCSGRLER